MYDKAANLARQISRLADYVYCSMYSDLPVSDQSANRACITFLMWLVMYIISYAQ